MSVTVTAVGVGKGWSEYIHPKLPLPLLGARHDALRFSVVGSGTQIKARPHCEPRYL